MGLASFNQARRLAAEKAEVHPAEPVGPQFDGIGTDSADQFSDQQLRDILTQVDGKAPHPQMKRETMIAKINALNAKAAAA